MLLGPQIALGVHALAELLKLRGEDSLDVFRIGREYHSLIFQYVQFTSIRTIPASCGVGVLEHPVPELAETERRRNQFIDTKGQRGSED